MRDKRDDRDFMCHRVSCVRNVTAKLDAALFLHRQCKNSAEFY